MPVPASERALSYASACGLDWFSFFLADIQTGFGPFVAIYLTAHQWAQFDIGGPSAIRVCEFALLGL